LTAILQLRSLPQPRVTPSVEGLVRSRGSVRSRTGPGTVLVEPRSKAPPRRVSRRRCYRPQDGLATRPLTSSCALGELGTPGSACATPRSTTFPSPEVADPVRAPSRQRRQHAPRQDAFHRRVLPPPSAYASRTPGAPREYAWDQQEPATGVAAARRWLSPPRPGFRRVFAHRAHPLAREAGELDPEPIGLDRAPLVDFCNQSIHEHHHRSPDPRPSHEGPGQRALARGARPRRGAAEASPDDLPPPSTGGAVLRRGRGRSRGFAWNEPTATATSRGFTSQVRPGRSHVRRHARPFGRP